MKSMVSRRYFVVGLGAVSAIPFLRRAAAATLSGPALNSEVSIENFSPAGKSLGIERVAKIMKTDAQWQAQRSPPSYRGARPTGPEEAVTGEYGRNHAGGIYQCIWCDTA